MKDKIVINKNKLLLFSLFIYFVVISAFQLTSGLESQFGKISLILILFVFLTSYEKIKINPIFKWLLLFWGYYYLSLFWSNNFSDLLYYLVDSLKLFILSIVITNTINTDDKCKTVLKLLVFSSLISVIVLFIKTPASSWGTERVGAAIGLNSNALGMHLSLSSIICFYFLSDMLKKNKTTRSYIKIILYIIMLTSFVMVMLFSGSKKAFICLILGILIFVILSTKGYKLLFKITLFLLLSCFLCNLILTNDSLYKVMGSRLESYIKISLDNNSNIKDISTLERSFYRKEAFELFKKNPIIGYGGNGFVTHLREIDYGHIAYCHNNYLELLSTLGLIGFLIYYSYYINLLKNILKKMENNLLYILFFTLIICLLILDYGNVSYFDQFNVIILSIISASLFKNKEIDCM